MPTWESLTAFGQELAGLERDLTGPEQRRITRTMGGDGQQIINEHFARDLGSNRAFSGWNRGAPIPADTRLRPARNQATLITPNRSSAGVITVAERGRNQGNASGFHGPGINRRTGLTARTAAGAVRRVRASRARRWNGTTAGKGTASRAVKDMERQLPRIADRAVLKLTRKRFDVT